MNLEEKDHIELSDNFFIICIILTKMIACTFCKIRDTRRYIQGQYCRLETWRIHKYTIVMRDNPKAKISVWVVRRHNLMHKGAW
jgi:hypothetical protein